MKGALDDALLVEGALDDAPLVEGAHGDALLVEGAFFDALLVEGTLFDALLVEGELKESLLLEEELDDASLDDELLEEASLDDGQRQGTPPQQLSTSCLPFLLLVSITSGSTISGKRLSRLLSPQRSLAEWLLSLLFRCCKMAELKSVVPFSIQIIYIPF